MFGLASLLLPAGYNNDMQYYQVCGPRPGHHMSLQVPKQDILQPSNHYELGLVVAVDVQAQLVEEGQDKEGTGEEVPEQKKQLVPMRSAKFLLLHVGLNTIFMFVTSCYVFLHHSKDSESDDALVIPQILGVIPGILFAVGKSFLMPDMCAARGDHTDNCQKVIVVLEFGWNDVLVPGVWKPHQGRKSLLGDSLQHPWVPVPHPCSLLDPALQGAHWGYTTQS